MGRSFLTWRALRQRSIEGKLEIMIFFFPDVKVAENRTPTFSRISYGFVALVTKAITVKSTLAKLLVATICSYREKKLVPEILLMIGLS